MTLLNDPSHYDADYPAAMESLTIASGGDLMLGVLYIAQGAGPHPTILLLHGFPGNERNFDLAQFLRRAGCNVLVFHYRGAWGSGGAFAFSHVLDDTAAALEFLRKNAAAYRIDPARIIPVGHSMGGWAALMAAGHEVPAAASIAGWNIGMIAELLDDVPEMKGQWLAFVESSLPPLKVGTAADLMGDLNGKAEAWNLLNRAAALATKPVLLVAASRDDDVPPGMHHVPLVRAFEAAGNPHITDVTLESDHVFSDRRIALAQTLLNWLDSLEIL